MATTRSKVTISLVIKDKNRTNDVEDFTDGKVTYHLKPEQETALRAWLEVNVLAKVRALTNEPQGEYALSLDVSGDDEKAVRKRLNRAAMLEAEGIAIAGMEALRKGALTT